MQSRRLIRFLSSSYKFTSRAVDPVFSLSKTLKPSIRQSEPTQQDRNDFLLLFLGMHGDIMKLQGDLLQITAGGADVMTVAPCLYGWLNVIMKERVETLENGKPLMVEGYPPTSSARMMSRWVREYDTAVLSLYDRTENLLTAHVYDSLSEVPPTVASTSASAYLTAVDADIETAALDSRRGRGSQQNSGK
ncbi:hypothetical protein G6011_04834 [Alternaria panax]|uniref:Uncharacterized protein n=1 Tax=Alternaria panax TaxID=48097 RepID=A0AAD4NUJ7_9PLEO|nr:hypothetical protein G6011_04834 [Alternaria panax]